MKIQYKPVAPEVEHLRKAVDAVRKGLIPQIQKAPVIDDAEEIEEETQDEEPES